MIALIRKNLACLISKHNTFVCKSHVSLSISLHFFSTWRERQLAASSKIFDVLVHKHHFPPQLASLAASDLTRFRSPEKADSILSFLKESGFSCAQLKKLVKYKPRILWANLEDIKFKIKIFRDLGLSSEEISKILSGNPVILHLRAKNKIIPQLYVLKGLVGSNYDVARLLRKSPWFPSADLINTMVPNVEFLKSCGIPMAYILKFLYMFPRFLLIKPELMRKSAERAKEMGFCQSSKTFIYAVRMIASTRKGTWEVKLQAFRDLGFSDGDVLTMFRKSAPVFGRSMKKIEKIIELLLATGKFNISSIVGSPISLGYSIEKRLKPRLQILGVLESKNLIRKWPCLANIFVLSDDKFSERFISPYSNEVGEVCITKSYVKAKKEVKPEASD